MSSGRPNASADLNILSAMTIIAGGKIRTVDVMDNGIVISFDDCRVAMYSAKLLQSIFDQALELAPDGEEL